MKIENDYRWIVDYKHLRSVLRSMCKDHGTTIAEFCSVYMPDNSALIAVMTDTGGNTYNDDENMSIRSYLQICNTFDLDPRQYFGVVRDE